MAAAYAMMGQPNRSYNAQKVQVLYNAYTSSLYNRSDTMLTKFRLFTVRDRLMAVYKRYRVYKGQHSIVWY